MHRHGASLGDWCVMEVRRRGPRRGSTVIAEIDMSFMNSSGLDEVRQAVADIGIQGVTVTEVQGFGRQHGHAEFYRGAEYSVDFLPKAKVELAVDDSIAEQVMEAICNVARTGKTGDGKVWILELEQALRVRTGETGPDAI